MDELHIVRRIKYQEDLDPGFGQYIASLPQGEDLFSCIQCGTCSGTCPVSIYMDYTPRRIIAMTRAGVRDEVLASNTLWLCASCYSCTVDCPKQIKITDIMYALKQVAIAEGVYPKRLPTPTLARQSAAEVRRGGRLSEAPVAVRTFLRTDPRLLLGHAGRAVRLMWKGRLPLGGAGMGQGREEVRRLLDKVEEVSGAAATGVPKREGH